MEYQEVDKLTVLPNKNSPINKIMLIKYAKLEKGSRVLGSITKRKIPETKLIRKKFLF